MRKCFQPESKIAQDILTDIRDLISVNFLREVDSEYRDSCIDNILKIYLRQGTHSNQEEVVYKRLVEVSRLLGCKVDDIRGDIDSFILEKSESLREDFYAYSFQPKRRKVDKTEKRESAYEQMVYSYDFTSEQHIIEEVQSDDGVTTDEEDTPDKAHVTFLKFFPEMDSFQYASQVSQLMIKTQSTIDSSEYDYESLKAKVMDLILSSEICMEQHNCVEKAANFVSCLLDQLNSSAQAKPHQGSFDEDGDLPNSSDLLEKYTHEIDSNEAMDSQYPTTVSREDETCSIISIHPCKSENQNDAISSDRINVEHLPEFCRPAIYHLINHASASKGKDFQNVPKALLNRVQSTIFPYLFYDLSTNILLSSPTGSGKTVVALLGILASMAPYVHTQKNESGDKYMLRKHGGHRFCAVYLAPMKALVQQVVATFQKCFDFIEDLNISELSGDFSMKYADIKRTNILVTTPEKWNLVSTKIQADMGLTEPSTALQPNVIIIDEIHLLHSERGGVIEAIVARSHSLVEQMQIESEVINAHSQLQKIDSNIAQHSYFTRLIAMSASFPNLSDVAEFLRVPSTHVFQFSAEYRPVPLTQHFYSLKNKNRSRTAAEQSLSSLTENILTEKLIEEVNGVSKSAIVFVHSRADTLRSAQKLLLGKEGPMASGFKELCTSLAGFSRRVSLRSLYHVESNDEAVYLVPIDKRGETLSYLFEQYLGSIREDFDDNLRVYDILQCIVNNTNIQQHYSLSPHLVDVISSGIGVHHAGLQPITRSFIESLFDLRIIQLLFSTSTLAWGVNLPASVIIIKGDTYQFKGKSRHLEALDVIQMFGRAGRPGRDTSGTAYLLSTGIYNKGDKASHLTKVQSYIQQKPVESFIMCKIVDLFLLEFGFRQKYSNRLSISDCIDWLKKTFWFIRSMNSNREYVLQNNANDVLNEVIQKVIYILSAHNLVDIYCAPSEGKIMENVQYANGETSSSEFMFEKFRSAFFNDRNSSKSSPSFISISTLGKLTASFAMSHKCAFQFSQRLFKDHSTEKSCEHSIFSAEDVLALLSESYDMTSAVGISESEHDALNKIALHYLPIPLTDCELVGVSEAQKPSTSDDTDVHSIAKKINILLQLYITRQLDSSRKNRFGASFDVNSKDHLIDLLRSSTSFHSDLTSITSSLPRVIAAVMAMCMHSGPLCSAMQYSGARRRLKHIETLIIFQRNLVAKMWSTSPEDAIRQLIEMHNIHEAPSDSIISRLENTKLGSYGGTFSSLLKYFNTESENNDGSQLGSIILDVICKGIQAEYSTLCNVFRAVPLIQVPKYRIIPLSSTEIQLSITVSLKVHSDHKNTDETFFLLVTDANEDALLYSSQFQIQLSHAHQNVYQGHFGFEERIMLPSKSLPRTPHLQIKILSDTYVGGAVDLSIPVILLDSLIPGEEYSSEAEVDESENEDMNIDDDLHSSDSAVIVLPPESTGRAVMTSKCELSFFDLLKKLDRKDSRKSPNTYYKILSKFDSVQLDEHSAKAVLQILCSDPLLEKYAKGQSDIISRDTLISVPYDSIDNTVLLAALSIMKCFQGSLTNKKVGSKVLILIPNLHTLQSFVKQITEKLKSYSKLSFASLEESRCSAELYTTIQDANVIILSPEQFLHILLIEKALRTSEAPTSSVLASVNYIVATELQDAFSMGYDTKQSTSLESATYEWVISRLRNASFYESCGVERENLPTFIAIGRNLTSFDSLSRWLNIKSQNIYDLRESLIRNHVLPKFYISTPEKRGFHEYDRSPALNRKLTDFPRNDFVQIAQKNILEITSSKTSRCTIFVPSCEDLEVLVRSLTFEYKRHTSTEAKEKNDGNTKNAEYQESYQKLVYMIQEHVEAVRSFMAEKPSQPVCVYDEFTSLLKRSSLQAQQEIESQLSSTIESMHSGVGLLHPSLPEQIKTALLELHRMTESLVDVYCDVAAPLLRIIAVAFSGYSIDISNFGIGSSTNILVLGRSYQTTTIPAQDGTPASEHILSCPILVDEVRSLIETIHQNRKKYGTHVPCFHIIASGTDSQILSEHFAFEKSARQEALEGMVSRQRIDIAKEEGEWVGEIHRDAAADGSNRKNSSMNVTSTLVGKESSRCQESSLIYHLDSLLNHEIALRSADSLPVELFNTLLHKPTLVPNVGHAKQLTPMTFDTIMEILQGTYYFQRFGLTPSFYRIGLSDMQLMQTYPLSQLSSEKDIPLDFISDIAQDVFGVMFDTSPNAKLAEIREVPAYQKKLMPIAGAHFSRLIDDKVVETLAKHGLCVTKDILLQEEDSDESEEITALIGSPQGLISAACALKWKTVAIWEKVFNRRDNALFSQSNERTVSPCNVLLALALSEELCGEENASSQNAMKMRTCVGDLENMIRLKLNGKSMLPLRFPQREFSTADYESLCHAIFTEQASILNSQKLTSYHYAVWTFLVAHLLNVPFPSLECAIYFEGTVLPKAKVLLKVMVEFCALACENSGEQWGFVGGDPEDLLTILALAQGLHQKTWPWPLENAQPTPDGAVSHNEMSAICKELQVTSVIEMKEHFTFQRNDHTVLYLLSESLQGAISNLDVSPNILRKIASDIYDYPQPYIEITMDEHQGDTEVRRYSCNLHRNSHFSSDMLSSDVQSLPFFDVKKKKKNENWWALLVKQCENYQRIRCMKRMDFADSCCTFKFEIGSEESSAYSVYLVNDFYSGIEVSQEVPL